MRTFGGGMTNNSSKNQPKRYTFPQMVWITCAIVATTVILILLVKYAASVFLLILASSLVSIALSTYAEKIRKWTHFNKNASLAIAIISITLLVILISYLIGAKVQQQIQELMDTLPKTLMKIRAYIRQNQLLERLFDWIFTPGTMEDVKPVATGFFSSTIQIIRDLYLITFISVFFTVSPELYKRGFVRLFPAYGRARVYEVLKLVNLNLKYWLKGALFSMTVVFVFTAIGLFIMGIPMWLALSLIAGLLSFIPNFGPLLALVPGILVGLSVSPLMAFLVLCLYLLVQLVESNFITPLVQQRLVNIAPALIIIAQVFMGVWLGGWGIVLATPLLVITSVLVKELFIKKQDQKLTR